MSIFSAPHWQNRPHPHPPCATPLEAPPSQPTIPWLHTTTNSHPLTLTTTPFFPPDLPTNKISYSLYGDCNQYPFNTSYNLKASLVKPYQILPMHHQPPQWFIDNYISQHDVRKLLSSNSVFHSPTNLLHIPLENTMISAPYQHHNVLTKVGKGAHQIFVYSQRYRWGEK